VGVRLPWDLLHQVGGAIGGALFIEGLRLSLNLLHQVGGAAGELSSDWNYASLGTFFTRWAEPQANSIVCLELCHPWDLLHQVGGVVDEDSSVWNYVSLGTFFTR
jgi:hypothetical protein